MSDILAKITEYKREEIAAAITRHPLAEVEAAAREADPIRGFTAALKESTKTGNFGLIAEIKKASPSRGLIRGDFEPTSLAMAYENGGASCLSVLTDGPSFQGAPEYLTSARASTSLPVLRKEFMLDYYQVVEARALGADCILIIMACVDDALANDLALAATTWGMETLVEVHDAYELERALQINACLIGINNRDLKTFETRLETTERLAPRVPHGHIVVSESGISTLEDMNRLARAGARAFLVGESLMRQRNVEEATRILLGADAETQGGAS